MSENTQEAPEEVPVLGEAVTSSPISLPPKNIQELAQQTRDQLDEVGTSGAVEHTPPEKPKVTLNKKVTIKWYNKEGQLDLTEEYYRSTLALARHIMETARPEHPEVEIVLTAVDPEAAIAAIGKAEFVVDERGPIQAVWDGLIQRCKSAQAVMHELAQLSKNLMDHSEIKGIIISVVDEGQGAGGQGFISESSPVADEDIKILASAAAGHVEDFKDTMRKDRNITFPGDGPIVLT